MKAKIGLFVISLFIPVISLSCPLCATKTGTDLRLALFGHDFLLNLFSVFFPFIFFILIALVIYYGPLGYDDLSNSSIESLPGGPLEDAT